MRKTGFRSQDSGVEKSRVEWESGVDRQAGECLLTPRPSTLNCSTRNLKEQTGNVDERKGQVKKSRSREVESQISEQSRPAIRGVFVNSSTLDYSTTRLAI